MSRRIFEAGESGSSRELSEEEKLKNEIRRRAFEFYSKKDWVQKLLKASGTSLEQWLDEQVTKEMEERKMRENNERVEKEKKESNPPKRGTDDLRDAAKKAFEDTDFKNIY